MFRTPVKAPANWRKRETDAALLLRVAEQFRSVAAKCDKADIKSKLVRIAAIAERLAIEEQIGNAPF